MKLHRIAQKILAEESINMPLMTEKLYMEKEKPEKKIKRIKQAPSVDDEVQIVQE